MWSVTTTLASYSLFSTLWPEGNIFQNCKWGQIMPRSNPLKVSLGTRMGGDTLLQFSKLQLPRPAPPPLSGFCVPLSLPFRNLCYCALEVLCTQLHSIWLRVFAHLGLSGLCWDSFSPGQIFLVALPGS